MESMRDTRRIMENEIKKGSTPLNFEKIELDENCYQEIASRDKLQEVLQYLHRVGTYKIFANKMVINNVYTVMRGRTPDFTRARSFLEREQIYHQMLRQEKKIGPGYQGDCFIETAKCYFSLPADEWERRRMQYKDQEAFGFILSNKYILGLYKFCREARRDFALGYDPGERNIPQIRKRLMSMENVRVLAHCLLLDDVWVENDLIGAKLYTVFVTE